MFSSIASRPSLHCWKIASFEWHNIGKNRENRSLHKMLWGPRSTSELFRAHFIRIPTKETHVKLPEEVLEDCFFFLWIYVFFSIVQLHFGRQINRFPQHHFFETGSGKKCLAAEHPDWARPFKNEKEEEKEKENWVPTLLTRTTTLIEAETTRVIGERQMSNQNYHFLNDEKQNKLTRSFKVLVTLF